MVLRTVDDPVAGSGEVVIAVEAAGMCHSDIGFWDGTLAGQIGGWPMVLGHEIAGTVLSLGPGEMHFAVGDRVAVPATRQGPGVAVNGGFAEQVVVDARLVKPIVGSTSFAQAAVATDAGISSYHAVVCCGQVDVGSRVGIIGLGGLGLLGAQTALSLGAQVFVAEIDEQKRHTATELGAAAVSDDITQFSDAGLDVVIDFVGTETSTDAALQSVRSGGRVVQVGLAAARGSIDLARLTFGSLSLVGSSGAGSHAPDLAAVFRLMEEGALRPHLELIAFEDIADGFSRLREGRVAGRLVAVPEAQD